MLMRFDPFRELDQVAQQVLRQAARPGAPMDAYRHGDQFVVQFDMPGVDPSSIDLTVEQNVLTVSAERQWQPAEGEQVVTLERPQGSFSRQIFLGEALDLDHIEASYDDGVLTVRVPVAEQAKPRKVEITSSGKKAQAIDTQSSETTNAA